MKSRKLPIESAEIRVIKVEAYSNAEYEGLCIQYTSRVGFGTYEFYKKKDDDCDSEWIIESNNTDDNTDKEFGKALLLQWLTSCIVKS